MSWETALARATEQLDWTVKLARNYVLPWWGRTLAEFPSPFWPSLLAMYYAHEGAKRYRLKGELVFAPARHVLTKYPEAGPGNLTCKPGDDEVRRRNVHPYDLRSHTWAVQWSFWEGVGWIDQSLQRHGVARYEQLALYDQVALLALQRAIGIGCTRGILRRSAQTFRGTPRMPIATMEAWLRLPGADTTPFDGSQTTETVRLRFCWCTRMIARSKDLGLDDLPARIAPPQPRPPDLVSKPRDFHAQMKWYAAQARRQGPAPTGPWPGG